MGGGQRLASFAALALAQAGLNCQCQSQHSSPWGWLQCHRTEPEEPQIPCLPFTRVDRSFLQVHDCRECTYLAFGDAGCQQAASRTQACAGEKKGPDSPNPPPLVQTTPSRGQQEMTAGRGKGGAKQQARAHRESGEKKRQRHGSRVCCGASRTPQNRSAQSHKYKLPRWSRLSPPRQKGIDGGRQLVVRTRGGLSVLSGLGDQKGMSAAGQDPSFRLPHGSDRALAAGLLDSLHTGLHHYHLGRLTSTSVFGDEIAKKPGGKKSSRHAWHLPTLHLPRRRARIRRRSFST